MFSTLLKIVMLVLIINASLLATSKEMILEDFNNLPPIKEKSITIKEYKDVGSLYILNGIRPTKNGDAPISVTVSKDMRYTFFGQAFDNKLNEQLYIQKDISKYKKQAHIKYGTGKKEYYIFTDPECPYCKELEKNLHRAKLKDDVVIYYFLYPLPMHKNAKAMSHYVLSQADDTSRLKALDEIIINNSTEYQTKSYPAEVLKKINSELENINEIRVDIGVRGTPSIYMNDGKKLNVQRFIKEVSKL